MLITRNRRNARQQILVDVPWDENNKLFHKKQPTHLSLLSVQLNSFSYMERGIDFLTADQWYLGDVEDKLFSANTKLVADLLEDLRRFELSKGEMRSESTASDVIEVITQWKGISDMTLKSQNVHMDVVVVRQSFDRVRHVALRWVWTKSNEYWLHIMVFKKIKYKVFLVRLFKKDRIEIDMNQVGFRLAEELLIYTDFQILKCHSNINTQQFQASPNIVLHELLANNIPGAYHCLINLYSLVQCLIGCHVSCGFNYIAE